MSLAEYKKKRDFAKTKEPAGRKPPPKTRPRSKTTRSETAARQNRFVIQKHDARQLHYDFRLEMEGVLKSWAVPKGVPVKKGEKRLAMRVEDHPLEYAGFEGIIEPGNYGAGSVMVWDQGSYESLEGEPEETLKKGKLVLRLHGKKLKSQWTLVRMRGRPNEEKESWLLIKSEEDIRPFTKKAEDQSVLSGRSMTQIAKDTGAVWESNRPADTSNSLKKN